MFSFVIYTIFYLFNYFYSEEIAFYRGNDKEQRTIMTTFGKLVNPSEFLFVDPHN